MTVYAGHSVWAFCALPLQATTVNKLYIESSCCVLC